MKRKILVVIGTRPNFIKVTQLKRVAEKYPMLELKLVHTGQHYDQKMSEVFFDQFELRPDYFLGIKAGHQIEHLYEIMKGLHKLIQDTYQPDCILVPGDVTSTLAGALVANKLGIKLGHIESGLRSRDHGMPEEINRILTDKIADIHFVTEESGMDNLSNEKLDSNAHFIGNTMIDTMVAYEDQISKDLILEQLKLKDQEFVLVTLHRPGLVDDEASLHNATKILKAIGKKCKVVFPVHPRSRNKMLQFMPEESFNDDNVLLIEPLGYFAFQRLVRGAKFVLTDSGGIQEETTYLQTPCLTLRPNTERPVTTDLGTNELVTNDLDTIMLKVNQILDGRAKKGIVPPLWDGRATERMLTILSDWV